MLPQYLKQKLEKVVAEIGNWAVYVHKAVLNGLYNIIDILSGILSVGYLVLYVEEGYSTVVEMLPVDDNWYQ